MMMQKKNKGAERNPLLLNIINTKPIVPSKDSYSLAYELINYT